VAILSSSGPVFSLSLVAALLGCLLSLNGFLLLVRIPFFN